MSGAVGSFAAPLTRGLSVEAGLIVNSTVGGLASVAGGGKFGNGAVTAASEYLFNETFRDARLRPAGVPDNYQVSSLGVDAAILAWFTAQVDYLTTSLGQSSDAEITRQYVVRAGMARAQDLESGTAFTQNGYGFSVKQPPVYQSMS